MLTDRETFKVAFLAKCAEQGFTIEETHEVIKQALHKSSDFWGLGSLAKGVMNTGSTIGKGIIGGAIAIPAMAGAATGYMLGSNSGASDEDIQEEKQRELIDAYQSAADRITSRNRRYSKKRLQPNTVRSLV